MKIIEIKNKIKYLVVLSLFGLFCHAFIADASQVTPEDIIQLTNQERKTLGLQSLLESEVLNKVAFLKAQDMIGNNYFAHTSPSGLDPWYWFKQASYSYKYAGENLAMDFESAQSVMKAWMKSKTHRDNIVSEKFQEIGVAVMNGVMDGKETQVAVQVFGTKLVIKGLNLNDEISEIKGEFSVSIEIGEASISPWQGSFEDEMLVFAEVSGEPQKVETVINGNFYPLEKLRENIYMNLISLKDINLAKDQVAIKASQNSEKAVFYQIPKESYNEYLSKKEKSESDSEEEKMIVMGPINSDSNINQILHSFSPDNLLVILAGVFLVTIANVWILEKEEEKLLKIKVS